jgi:hypothetical protein
MWWWICKEGKMFDAAIRELRIALAELAYDDDREQVRAALRVLEAAGKVDKRQAEAWLDAAHAGCPDYDVKDDIRALFAALPDAPKEEK